MPPPGLLESKSQQPQSSLLPMSDEKGLLGAMGLGLGEINRRKLLQGVAGAAIPKLPLQSLLKGISLTTQNMGDLFKLQAMLKKRMIRYLGSTVLGGFEQPGGFRGQRHYGSSEDRAIGEKYWKRLTKDYENLNEVMSKKRGTWTNLKPDKRPLYTHSDFSRSRELLDDALTKDVAPSRLDDPGFKTWKQVELEVRDEYLKQEKFTGRTLVTRSVGAGGTIPIGSPLETLPPPKPKRLELEGPERTTRPSLEEPERKPQPQPQPQRTNRPLSDSPRVTRTASPPVQLPSGRDISRMAMRGAATAAGWPLYAASFGIPTARSGESQVLAGLADQPGADVDAALRDYRQGLAQKQQELALRGGLLMSGMP